MSEGHVTDRPESTAKPSGSLSRRELVIGGLAGAAGLLSVGCARSPAVRGAIHRVEAGESLSSIAALYGIGVADLIQYNRLRQRHLAPGQELHLPPGAHRQPLRPAVQEQSPFVRDERPHGMVSRQQWGAPEPGSNWDLMGPVRFVTLHHTDEYPGMRGLSDEVVVQNICRYHRRLGWADIGYHYLVGRDGRIYEGRRVDRQGAHSGGANNRNNLGISLIGNFERRLPDSLQLEPARRLLSEQLRHYNLARSALRGHREWSPTICPGDALFAWMVSFRDGRIS
ncbi:MAG: LysM peptidoglycan-binding domain-containing protein [Planctomycetota bacterium]|nr:MAG: LysM peptidoglycan-binding domain-containing protein [Planctomycetota bacterium]